MVEISHQLASVADNWIDVRNIEPFLGQQFTAGHTGNKDLDRIDLTGRVFGSAQLDASNVASLQFPVPLPSLWTYNGTNFFTASQARLLSGNSGVYASYQIACVVEDGQVFSINFIVDGSNISSSGDVSFDLVVTSVGGSQVVTFPMHVYEGSHQPDYVLKIVANEAWTEYKIEFDNFVWNGTGYISIEESVVAVKTSVESWVVNDKTKLLTKLYDDTNQSISAVCDDYAVRLFPSDRGGDMTGTELQIPSDTEVYAIVAGRSYRTVTDIQDQDTLENQLSELTVPVLPNGADPQVQSSAITPENLVAGSPWDITATFELNPDKGSDVFAGDVRRDGEVSKSDVIAVVAGDDYTFRARVRIPSTGGATTYTISVKNENDESILVTRSQALVDQVPDYFFEEELSVTVPADSSTIYFTVTVTVAVPSLYVDGVMLTKDSDGTPVKYHYSTRVAAPVSVAMKTAASEVDPMDAWVAGAWSDITFNSLVTTVWAGESVSELPTGEEFPVNDLLASVSWPNDPCDQPAVMADIISILQTAGDSLAASMRPIIQVNKPTKPMLSDWISAYKKAGGVGSIPNNGSFRWSDSSQSDKEYTSESIILTLEEGVTAPVPENGTALLGSITRIPFNFVNVAKDVLDEISAPISYTDGWQLYIDLLRGGELDARMLYSTTAVVKIIPFHLDAIWALNWVVSKTAIEAPSNVIATVGHQILEVNTVAAGELDLYWGLATSPWTPDVFEFCALSAILDPEDMLLPMSQIEVYHV